MTETPPAAPRLRSARTRLFLYLGLMIVYQWLYTISAVVVLLVLQAAGLIGAASAESDGLEALTDPFSGPGALVLLFGFVGWILITLGLWKLIDRRRIRDLGLGWNRRAATDLALGFLAAAAGAALVFAAAAAIGLARLDGWQPRSFGSTLALLAGQLAILLIAAAAEEIAFRGYVLQNLLPSGRTAAAVLISSLLFSIIHVSNPHYLAGLAAPNIILIGVLFSLTYLWRRSLWFPIGLHLGWNFMIGPILSVPVSGVGGFPGLLRSDWAFEPWLWGGGRFGPEGGLLCTLATAIPVAIIFLWRRNRCGPGGRILIE
jgi:membrane protease YdiL (CAAX protease family)